MTASTCLVAVSMQELSPTTDANLVVSLMNLIDCLSDEFRDEAKASQMEDREINSWLEVCRCMVKQAKVTESSHS